MNILAISGSLRRQSSNAALLRAMASVAPTGVRFVLYDGLESLPQFNPDRDRESDVPAPPVAAWRAAMHQADGVVISSPEYGHGVPGSLKNALDWLVSSGELMGKPVVLLNAARAGGKFAQASLAETLTMLSANVLREASQLEPFLRHPLSGGPEPLDAELAATLRASFAALANALPAQHAGQ